MKKSIFAAIAASMMVVGLVTVVNNQKSEPEYAYDFTFENIEVIEGIAYADVMAIGKDGKTWSTPNVTTEAKLSLENIEVDEGTVYADVKLEQPAIDEILREYFTEEDIARMKDKDNPIKFTVYGVEI